MSPILDEFRQSARPRQKPITLGLMKLKRATAVGLCSIVAGLLAPAGARAAVTAPSCTNDASALRFQVDRNTNGRDKPLRTIDLRPGHGTSATSVRPVSLTIMRRGRIRTLHFANLEDQYVYRARRGEQSRFLAVYLEDSSGYGSVTFGQQELVSVPVPVPIPAPALAVLPAPLQALFAGGKISVLLPALSSGAGYGQNACARALPLTVGEATVPHKASTRRRF
ncbi:MAG: hypothetical protein ACR2LA_09515 [Acidimicrobiales bacterium]